MKHKRKLTPEELDLIEGCSALNMPYDQMAVLLKTSASTFDRMIKTYPALREALARGRTRGSRHARTTLYTMATGSPEQKLRDKETGEVTKIIPAKEPDFQALKFWCQTQEGFRSADRLELTGANGAPLHSADDQSLRELFGDKESVDMARALAQRMVQNAKEKK